MLNQSDFNIKQRKNRQTEVSSVSENDNRQKIITNSTIFTIINIKQYHYFDL